MSADYVVIGHFSSITAARAAVREFRATGYDDALEVYSPFPDHGLEDDLYSGKRRSWVRIFTLIGGLSGCIGAFIFTSWMSIDYPLRVSAKPLVSIPSFIIIAFECTILLGAIFTLLSMFHFSRIPSFFRKPEYRGNFSSGTFGVTVRGAKEVSEELEQKMKALGADQTELQYVR